MLANLSTLGQVSKVMLSLVFVRGMKVLLSHSVVYHMLIIGYLGVSDHLWLSH